jgi:hypothetical protein
MTQRMCNGRCAWFEVELGQEVTWVVTVRRLMNSVLAISRSMRPSAIRRSTSRLRDESSTTPSVEIVLGLSGTFANARMALHPLRSGDIWRGMRRRRGRSARPHQALRGPARSLTALVGFPAPSGALADVSAISRRSGTGCRLLPRFTQRQRNDRACPAVRLRELSGARQHLEFRVLR